VVEEEWREGKGHNKGAAVKAVGGDGVVKGLLLRWETIGAV
jgi:hypothetical protein